MNTLQIQQYENEIAVLVGKVRRLEALDHAQPAPSFYICTRCGLLYQSPWGCGCVVASSQRGPHERKTSDASCANRHDG